MNCNHFQFRNFAKLNFLVSFLRNANSDVAIEMCNVKQEPYMKNNKGCFIEQSIMILQKNLLCSIYLDTKNLIWKKRGIIEMKNV